MSSYLTREQVDQILRPINKSRVGVRDGMSYVEAYEVKAHMARIFGVARWSSEVVVQEMICEEQVQTRAGKPAWYVAYRSIVKVTVCAPDGTHLAVYSEGHAGDSTHPTRGEAHGNAITNSESYAFKRAACMALLDQGGLSLYGKGSTAALVKRTLVMPEGEPVTEAVDHDAPPVIAEDAPDRDTGPAQDSPPAAPSPSAPDSLPSADGEGTPQDGPDPSPEDLFSGQVEGIRIRVHEAMKMRSRNEALMKLTRINLDAGQAGVMQQMTTTPTGEPVSVAVLIDGAIKALSRTEK